MVARIKTLLALAWLAVAIGAGAAPAGSIGAADIKGEWPLTVAPPVRVVCQAPNLVMVEAQDGKLYGVNGKARDGVREVDEIWRVIDAKGRRASNMVDVAMLAMAKCRDSGQFKS